MAPLPFGSGSTGSDHWVRGCWPLQSARKVAMENRTLAEREFGNI
jgi:hypothetical protein